MDLSQRISYAANWIDGIARSDHLPIDDVIAALDRVAAYAQAAKSTAIARPRETVKIAVGTDEAAIREKIAGVRKAIELTDDETVRETLRDMESTLGAMLPPVTGTLRMSAAAVVALGGG